MPPGTQQQLDAALDRQHTFAVEISADAPLPENRQVYDPLRQLPATGFQFTTRELLHAIGSKTAALPVNQHDDCIRASLLYTYILDLDAANLCFLPFEDSDLVTPRSQEIGIGMTCLLANRIYNVPWDQLGSLPGQGLRFDYRARRNNFDAIFESKGTRHRGNQNTQIESGIEKKDAHHERGEQFDVELIVSTFVGTEGTIPRILIGDPDFDELGKIYERADNRFFRLRHYARILQFVGLPRSAFLLNEYAKKYLRGERGVSDAILEPGDINDVIIQEKERVGYLEPLQLGQYRYFGRWFNSIAPEDSKRYKAGRYEKLLMSTIAKTRKTRVFQGMRDDIYFAGAHGEPFSHNLLSPNDIRATLNTIDRPVSLFPDGTIQFFEQGN